MAPKNPTTSWTYPQQLDLYVSPANGVDTNNGLSPSTPVATLEAAYARLPLTQTVPVVIHMASGAYDATFLGGINQVGPSARIWLYGDGAGQEGDDGFAEVLPSESVASATALSLDSTSVLTAGALEGSTLEVLTGPGAGMRKTIASNTASTIVPCAAFGTVPTAASTFRVVDPAADIDMDAVGRDTLFSGLGTAAPNNNAVGGPFLALVNLSLSGGVNLPTVNNCGLLLQGVKQAASFGPLHSHCIINAGYTQFFDLANENIYADLGLPVETGVDWHGWALSHPGGFFVWQGADSFFTGFIHSSGRATFQHNAEIFGGKVESLFVTRNGFVRINSTNEPSFTAEGAESDGSVKVDGGGHCQVGCTNMVINNTGSGACVLATAGGRFSNDEPTSRPTGSNTGSGPGLRAAGGQIVFEGAPLITGSTPGTNDTELDDGTQAGNAAYSAAGTGISNLASAIARIS